jgi:DNA-binding NarL/FixJ family response regulator
MPEADKINKRILIVDSSPLIIGHLVGILKDIDVANEVFEATDFNEAVNVLKEKKIVLVLLDIQLPGKKGIELLKYIVEVFPGINVIILTNLVSIYYQRLCKNLGAVHFIDKSKDFDQIPEILAGL